MILELAIGDAYGAGFEYVRDRRFITRYNDLSQFVRHPTHALRPGEYTDDTQMSLAIAELVVQEPVWTVDLIASRFVACFHRDPRQGYSGRFYDFLKRHKSGSAFLADIDATSDKSGAAMRAAPIGVFWCIDEVVARSTLQAQVTHNTRDGVNAAVAVSLSVHYFLYDLGPKHGLGDFLKDRVEGDWGRPWVGEVGSRGWMSVRAAITSLIKNDSMSSILRSAVAWSGDTDTVASIAMALASASKEIKQDLPYHLVNNVEDGDFGRHYIQELDRQLRQKHKLEYRKRRNGFANGWTLAQGEPVRTTHYLIKNRKMPP
jgi:ADP-ribosylglycohydrolase